MDTTTFRFERDEDAPLPRWIASVDGVQRFKLFMMSDPPVPVMMRRKTDDGYDADLKTNGALLIEIMAHHLPECVAENHGTIIVTV